MPTETCNRVLVERYFLGELGTEGRRAMRAHLDECAGCRGRMSDRENERRQYLLEHPFREFAAGRPAGKGAGSASPFGKPASFPRWLPAVAGLAACLILVPLALRYGVHDAAISDSGVRTKGGPILAYYLKRGGVILPGSPAETHRAGDELQFVYSADGHPYVTLASIDARGHVSLYRDPEAALSGSVDTLPLSLPAGEGGKTSLPFAVTLDDSPGSELFVMIFGSEPLTGGAVEGWLMGAFTRASGNLGGVPSLLFPPPGTSGKPAAGGTAAASAHGRGSIPAAPVVRTLLLRKSQA